MNMKMYTKVRELKELTDITECYINDSQNDIIEELINVQTDASDQNVDNGQNQNENMT